MLNDLAQKIKSANIFKKENFLLFFWPFQFLVVGLIIGYFVPKIFLNDTHEVVNIEVHRFQAEYPFINPLMACDFGEQKIYSSFEGKIIDYLAKAKKQKKIAEVSVIFRDLKKGDWFGIEEEREFAPASLLKVPLMMVYFKEAEENPGIFNEKIYFDGVHENITVRNIIPTVGLKKGDYTVEELIKMMIIYSDNDALDLLFKHLDDYKKMDALYSDLGISPADLQSKEENIVSVRTYSSLFRVLYNASYLSKEMSNKALEILSRSEFGDGIKAKLPREIKIAHKFGERGTVEDLQLHDCG